MNRSDILIEAEELLGKIDDPNIRIYDATILFFRKDDEQTAYEKYVESHLPGAAFFDHEKFSDPDNNYMYMVLPEDALAQQIGKIGISAESEVIVYTRDLMPCATRAWWVLRYAGHNNVRVLNGGISAWEAIGGKIEQGASEYEPASFECKLRPEMFASKEDVLSAMEDGEICTVNTLNQESYQNAHITGSSSLPCENMLINMTAFVPDEELAKHLQQETAYKRVITYCGGGIAATVNAIAHLIAGNENVAVYDGSMNEWTSEGLPTTTSETV